MWPGGSSKIRQTCLFLGDVLPCVTGAIFSMRCWTLLITESNHGEKTENYNRKLEVKEVVFELLLTLNFLFLKLSNYGLC